MKEQHVKFLICPKCRGALMLSVTKRSGQEVETGELTCYRCMTVYPVVNSVPRFVKVKNYSSNFGLEWMKHATTQYDSYSGVNVSEQRFFEETKWERNLRGQLILETGGGSGRFTEQAAGTGATVISIDFSAAVDANIASNGGKDNVFIIQADLYNLPFPDGLFDKLFCFGVLQHTPDVRRAFMTLPRYLKRGGSLVMDVYRKLTGIKHLLKTKYWIRPITRKMNHELLYRLTSAYVQFMWPVSKIVHRLPFGKQLNWALCIADYRDVYPLKEEILLEWAVLDTFDMLSPAYDQPQALQTVRRWFRDARLENIDVGYGAIGIAGRGTKA